MFGAERKFVRFGPRKVGGCPDALAREPSANFFTFGETKKFGGGLRPRRGPYFIFGCCGRERSLVRPRVGSCAAAHIPWPRPRPGDMGSRPLKPPAPCESVSGWAQSHMERLCYMGLCGGYVTSYWPPVPMAPWPGRGGGAPCYGARMAFGLSAVVAQAPLFTTSYMAMIPVMQPAIWP